MKLNKVIFFKVLIPLLLFFLQQVEASAPGFIVTTKGDTLRGEIAYTDILLTPHNVSFKKAGSSNWQKLGPKEINYFELNNKSHTAYRTYRGAITMDRTAAEILDNFRDTSIKIDTIFLRVVQTGKLITLYQYQDSYKERYFISVKAAPAYELIFRRYFSYYPNNTFGHKTMYENTYRLQLMDISNQYKITDDEFFRLIEDSDYKKLSLVKLVNKMNHEN